MRHLYTKKDVCQICGYCAQHIARMEAAGDFPRRLPKPGGNPNAKALWVADEVQAWIEAKIQERDASASS